jgi:hypothetical protein
LALKISRNRAMLREKLKVRKEGEMKAILNLPPKMNWRIKKTITDKKATTNP